MAKKNPGYGKQLVLAIFLFALASFSYWLVYSQKPKEEAKQSDEKKVFVLKNQKVRSLEIRGVALNCLSLKDGLCKSEDSSTWELTSPLKTKADDATINGLLKNFSNITSSEMIDLSTETPEKRESLLKDYGLSSEQRKSVDSRKIKITLEDGRSFTAYFGGKHPIVEGVFTLLESATPDENRILIVPDWQISVFDQKTSYFRDKKIFSINDREVLEFNISASRKIPGKLQGIKDETTQKWTLISGGRKLAGDQDGIEGVLSGAVFLNAKDYISEKKDSPEGKAALSGLKPVFDLELKTKTTRKRIRVFAKKKAYYGTLEDQDPIFEIDSFAFDKLDKPMAELRLSKLIGVADRYALTSLQIEAKGKKPFKQEVLKESSGAWKINGAESARGRVEGILDRLTSKIVKDFTGPTPNGDILKITFGKTPKEPLHQIEFWKNGDRLFARDLTSAERETVELMSDFSMQLPWDERFLKDVNFGVQKNEPHHE